MTIPADAGFRCPLTAEWHYGGSPTEIRLDGVGETAFVLRRGEVRMELSAMEARALPRELMRTPQEVFAQFDPRHGCPECYLSWRDYPIVPAKEPTP